jgi:uncharacterized protein YndB with AHSA1/START domain
MKELSHVVERAVTIAARRETVFAFFTDSARFAAWWGEGSTIDPRPGGKVHIRYPNGVVAGGEVVEVEPVAKIVFTFGYAGDDPLPLGASRVTICLEESLRGTVVRLRHELPSASAAEVYVQGWRYQLSVFAHVVALQAHADVGPLVDRFFALWAETDGAKRRAALRALAVPELSFRDPYSCLEGVDDLDAHIGAAQRFMPGVVLQRQGDARHCQGTAVVDWAVNAPDGSVRARGTNVFELAPDGRIARVTGVWS